MTVTVTPGIQYQAMEGFGTAQRIFDDPHVCEKGVPRCNVPQGVREQIMRQLYTDLGLTVVRSAAPDFIEPENDNNDPNVFDWSKFRFEGKRNDGHVDYAKLAMRYGLTTPMLTGGPGDGPPSWLKPRDPNGPAEYAEHLLAAVMRWRDLGLAPPWISIMNEPSQKSEPFSGEFLRDTIKILGRRLRSAGLQTKIQVPDDINPARATEQARVILADPEARQYVRALSTHLYNAAPGDMERLRELASQHNVPLWMTEYSEEAKPPNYRHAFDFVTRIMHEMLTRFHVSQFDYMSGFIGEWGNPIQNVGATFIVITFDASGNYVSHALNSVYYLFGQYSRSVRPGMIRMGARSTNPHVKVTAFRHPQTRAMTAVAINEEERDIPVTFDVSATGVREFPTVYRTSPTENWATLPPIRLAGLSFTTTLRGQSVTTFSTVEGRRLRPSSLPMPPRPSPVILVATGPLSLLLLAGFTILCLRQRSK
ncbi:MAG: hypothetical protein ACRDIC_11120 [bacterium]